MQINKINPMSNYSNKVNFMKLSKDDIDEIKEALLKDDKFTGSSYKNFKKTLLQDDEFKSSVQDGLRKVLKEHEQDAAFAKRWAEYEREVTRWENNQLPYNSPRPEPPRRMR